MKISPDYKYKHTCHFCHKRFAVKGHEFERSCFYIVKASHYVNVYHSARYLEIAVEVPQCEKCCKIDRRISIINIIIILLVFVISSYFFSWAFADNEGYSTPTLKQILIAFLPSFVTACFVGYGVACIVRSILEYLWKYSSYCDDYVPIKKLKGINFEPRDNIPNLKDPDLKGNGPLDKNRLQKVISDIVVNDHCIFKS